MNKKTVKKARAKKKNAAKQPAKTRKKLASSMFSYLKAYKLRVLLIVVLIGVACIPVIGKYRDHTNANNLRNLEVDFRQLVTSIEETTSTQIEVTKGCFETQEKFNNPVRSCGLIGSGNKPEAIDNIVELIDDSTGFNVVLAKDFNSKLKVSYAGIEGCEFSFGGSSYIICDLLVRDANYELSKELFQNGD